MSLNSIEYKGIAEFFDNWVEKIHMPTSANSVGASLAPLEKPVKNPKTVHITPATNGFVVQLQKVDDYEQDYSIATSVEDITKILTDYFN